MELVQFNRKMAKKVAKKKAAAKPVKKASPVKKAAKQARRDPLDLSGLPPEAIAREERYLCLACALDLFTRHMGIPAAKAQNEIKRYEASAAELAAPPTRPYFAPAADACPYCEAPAKWHAPVSIARIEGSRATDAARRALIKNLPPGDFYTVEEKATQRDALFDWLAHTSQHLDLDNPNWLIEASLHWMGRRFPKHDWVEEFRGVHAIRRSRRLEEGFEKEGGRIFLAPSTFDEILFIQYLLSRSHKHGGLTFEGRLTLHDLIHRLRGGGYLRAMGVAPANPSDVLEKLMDLLGGEGGMKYHFVIDRRKVLERLKELKDARVPKPKGLKDSV
jgi:hypothetical protein